MNRLCLLALLAFPTLATASTVYIQIDVTQDGGDVLYFQGTTLRWQHQTDFANSTATITAKINGVTVLSTSLANNGIWANGDTGQSCSGSLSCPLFDVTSYTLPAALALPSIAQTVTLQSLLATYGNGGTATTVAGATCASAPCTIAVPTNANNQQPNAGDGYTLKIALDDHPLGGTHDYSIGITFSDGVTTPEPTTLALSAVGLLALGLTARRRKGVRSAMGTPTQ